MTKKVKSPQEIINTYIDLAVAREAITNDDKYTDKIKLYDTDNGCDLIDELDDKYNTAENAFRRLHPYFKTRNAKTVWCLGNLAKLFHEGKVRVEYDVSDYWGDPAVSKVVTNPTNLDMYALADEAIRMSGDLHHIFIEDFKYSRTNDGVRYYKLWTGS